MSDVQRSTIARLGVVALNLLAPGLGLLRLAEIRTALPYLVAPLVTSLALMGFYAVAPDPGFRSFVIIAALLVASVVALYLGSMILTWRRSRFVVHTKPWWTRWYGLLAMLIVATIAGNLATSLAHRFYKPFYAPSESMTPTIGKGDRFLADMRGGRDPRIGDVLLFATADGIRTARVAALAGDRIAMRKGVPMINGQPAEQRDVGTIAFADFDGPAEGRRLVERLPGEAGSHMILDLQETSTDDTAEVTVPPAHVFVLGDNRDRAADSRVPQSLSGVGMLPLNAIHGRPLFIHWSGDRAKIGARIAP